MTTPFDTLREALLHSKDAIIERGLDGNPDFAERWGLTLPLERIEQALVALAQIEADHFTASDMASAAAQGHRDGVASVTQGPVAEWVKSPMGSYPMLVWERGHTGAIGDKLFVGAAPVTQQHEPVKWWNNCDKTVPKALRYLAQNDRPSGGEDRFNAHHLMQLADEIERMAAHPLFAAPVAQQQCVCGQPTTLGVVHRTDGPCFVYEGPAQQPQAEAAEAVNETNAVLASRYFDLLRVVEQYEKNGVTCQTYRHFVTEPCAECNSPGRCAKQQAEAVPPKRATGWVAPKDRYTTPVLFNPYTGAPRDVRDVQSDPQGILIVPPGALISAAQGAKT